MKKFCLTVSDRIRFWKKVDCGEVNDCWEWSGNRSIKGYGMFYLCQNGKDTTVRASRVAFLCEYGYLPQYVLHKCSNPCCCNPKHLFAGAQSENILQSVQEGSHVDNRGEKHGRCRLTANKVRRIRELYAQGYTQRIIAARFKVSRSYVSMLCSKKNWKHLI